MSSNEGTTTLLDCLREFSIEIPRVQRDYAQGRNDPNTTLVRTRLIEDLRNSVERNTPPADLSFVYGRARNNGCFVPIDGQQRLTTLFLLHLYAFADDKAQTDLLRRFTYETRASSRKFLEKLVEERESVFNSRLPPSEEIRDSAWFIPSWESDPTIYSVLTMLTDIKQSFPDRDSLAVALQDRQQPVITFQFLKMDDLGMEDSLYIKLNARGKPLTPFENFRARLIGRLTELESGELADRGTSTFEQLLDGKWTDLFWSEHKLDFDRAYLAFFGTLAQNRHFANVDQENWSNAFDYASLDSKFFDDVRYTLNYLCDALPDDPVRKLFSRTVSKDPSYADRVLFHAVTTYLSQAKETDAGTLPQWLRIFQNLVANTRIDDKRSCDYALNGINEIAVQWNDLLTYFAEGGDVSGFSRAQVSEEVTKARLIQGDVAFADPIYRAEAHPYFSGQIRSALALATNDLGQVDLECFEDYWRKISGLFEDKKPKHPTLLRQALLTIGDYTLDVGGYKTLCVDSPTEPGRTPSLKQLFSNRAYYVKPLLDSITASEDIEASLTAMIREAEVPRNDWRHCFLEYPNLMLAMSPSHLRLLEADGDLLLIANKSSAGYNQQLFLSALDEELVRIGVHSTNYQYRGRTIEGNHHLELDQEKALIVRYSEGVFTIATEPQTGTRELLFRTNSQDPIREALKYISSGTNLGIE